MRLPPAEELFDVGELELDVGRAAVVALAGQRGLLHLAQQRVHLLHGQPPARAHAAVARHGRAHRVQPLLQRRGAVPFRQLVGRALAVVELAIEEDFAPPDSFEIIDERRYGDTRIVFLRWSP